jgi:hypothetical protein
LPKGQLYETEHKSQIFKNHIHANFFKARALIKMAKLPLLAVTIRFFGQKILKLFNQLIESF